MHLNSSSERQRRHTKNQTPDNQLHVNGVSKGCLWLHSLHRDHMSSFAWAWVPERNIGLRINAQICVLQFRCWAVQGSICTDGTSAALTFDACIKMHQARLFEILPSVATTRADLRLFECVGLPAEVQSNYDKPLPKNCINGYRPLSCCISQRLQQSRKHIFPCHALGQSALQRHTWAIGASWDFIAMETDCLGFCSWHSKSACGKPCKMQL